MISDFANDSDVKMVPHGTRAYRCEMCSLAALVDEDDEILEDARHALTHLHQHQVAGHAVPLTAFQKLRDQLDSAPRPDS